MRYSSPLSIPFGYVLLRRAFRYSYSAWWVSNLWYILIYLIQFSAALVHSLKATTCMIVSNSDCQSIRAIMSHLFYSKLFHLKLSFRCIYRLRATSWYQSERWTIWSLMRRGVLLQILRNSLNEHLMRMSLLSSSDTSDGAMITQAINTALAELLDCSAVYSCYGRRELHIPLNRYLIFDDIRLTTSKLMRTFIHPTCPFLCLWDN